MKTYLYHYTSFESAIKILSTKKLRFSGCERLNDINESNGPIIINDNEHINELLKNYKLLSFSMDKKGRKGFDIPAMWGHYAERGNGVCLSFDKEAIEQRVNEQKWYAHEIIYYNSMSLNAHLYDEAKYGSPDNFIWEEKDSLFFEKSTDWKYEQEYRIIAINDRTPLYLDITGCIHEIILYDISYESFIKSVNFNVMAKLAPLSELFCYTTVLGGYLLFNHIGEQVNEIHYDFNDIFHSSKVQ